jgi:hypothetical protein
MMDNELNGDGLYIWSVADSVTKARHFFDWNYAKQVKNRQQILTVERMLDGAAPHDQEKLDAAGLGYVSNKNFGEGRFHVRSVEYTFWGLQNEVQNIAKFVLDMPPPETSDLPQGAAAPNYLLYENTLADVWTKALKAWSKFGNTNALIGSYICRFGSSLVVWDIPGSWYYKAIHPLNVCVPVDAKANVEDWYWGSIITSYTPEELWRIVKNPEASSSVGWNIESLKDLLFSASSIYGGTKAADGLNETQWAALESSVCESPNGIVENYGDDFKLVSMWYRQKNGKIGQVLFSKGYITPNFLYKKENAYDSFKDFSFLFTFQPGVEYYSGLAGVGQDIFELVDAITLTDCKVLDQVHIASTLLVSSGTQVGQDSRGFDLTIGGINDLGSGTLQQSNIYNAITPTISGAQYFRQNLQNAGVLGGFNASVPDSVKRGREEMAQKSGREYKVYKNYTAHHYDELDMFLKTLFRRFLDTSAALPGGKELAYFKEKLERQQFPMETLKGKTNIYGLPVAWEISSSRILGSGSNTADQALANDLYSMAGMLGPEGRKNLIKYIFAIKTGYEHQAAFFPKGDDAQQPNNEDSVAVLENDMIRMGMPVEFGENQDHFRHATRHAQVGIDLQNEIESHQLDPAKYKAQPDDEPVIVANMVLQQLIPHWVKHLVALDSNPLMAGEAKQLKIVYGSLVNFARKMQAASLSAIEAQKGKAEKMSQQEMDLARQQNIDTQEIQMKSQKVQSELALKAGQIARQVDAETLLSLRKLEIKGDVEKISAAMKHRENVLKGSSDSGSK